MRSSHRLGECSHIAILAQGYFYTWIVGDHVRGISDYNEHVHHGDGLEDHRNYDQRYGHEQ